MTGFYPGWGFSKLTCKIFGPCFSHKLVHVFSYSEYIVGTPFWLPAFFFKITQILKKYLKRVLLTGELYQEMAIC